MRIRINKESTREQKIEDDIMLDVNRVTPDDLGERSGCVSFHAQSYVYGQRRFINIRQVHRNLVV